MNQTLHDFCHLITSSMSLHSPNSTKSAEETNSNQTLHDPITEAIEQGGHYFPFIVTIFLGILAILFAIIEVVQCLTNCQDWVKEIKNWLQLLILTMTFFLLCSLWFPKIFSKRVNWCSVNRHCFSVLAYYEFLYELGYHPKCTHLDAQ